MFPEELRLHVGQVGGFVERLFNGLRRLDPRVAVGDGREGHEPVIVHIDRLSNIGLPKLGLVQINWHVLTRDKVATSQPAGHSGVLDAALPQP